MELLELDAWIASQNGVSIAAMERAISAAQLCRHRDRFGQVITPALGSVLASPEFADWDPRPDYFFHWVRDSALVMRTVAELMEDAKSPMARERWQRHFENFVRFSLKITEANERCSFAALSRAKQVCSEADQKFLRNEAEFGTLSGDVLRAEPRFNPDGSLDIFRWSRPQYDGPALRALACLRYLAAGGDTSDEIVRLLRCDLQFTVAHAGAPCIGPWEEPEQNSHHYYVDLVQLAALIHGRAWAMQDRERWRDAEQKLRDGLEQYWTKGYQLLLPMRPASAESEDDLLDAVTVLAAWDADLPNGPHSIIDSRLDRAQAAIEALFARELPINRGHTVGPALGRTRRDRYFGGGAWYPTTLAAAGLCYRRARRREAARRQRRDLIAHGDAFLATLRKFTPTDGALSEQIDRDTGAQTSSRHLTWSYAAFISTARERNLALAMQ